MTRVIQFGPGTMGLPKASTLHRGGVAVAASDTDPAAMAAFADPFPGLRRRNPLEMPQHQPARPYVLTHPFQIS